MLMRDRRTARRVLGAALTEHADQAFGRRGYRRVSRSLAYRRAVADGHHRWSCDFELHPGAEPREMALFPAVEVVFPPVIEIARRMLPQGSAALIHYSLRLAVASFAPPAHRHPTVRSEAEAAEFAGWLAGLLDGALGHAVDAMATVDGFARVLTSGTLTGQPMTPVNWVSVAAAHLYLGDRALALGVLQRHVDGANPELGELARAYLGSRRADGAVAPRQLRLGVSPSPV